MERIRALHLGGRAARASAPKRRATAGSCHSDQFETAEGNAGAGADADIAAKDVTAEAAAARAQLVQELGNDRFCGALYILIESRNHTNTKTVNASSNVLHNQYSHFGCIYLILFCFT